MMQMVGRWIIENQWKINASQMNVLREHVSSTENAA